MERNAAVEPADDAETPPAGPSAPAVLTVSVLDTRKALIALCRNRFSAGKYARLYSAESITDDMDKEQLKELKRTLNKLMDDVQGQLSDDCLDLAFVGADGHWVLEAGEFRLQAGNQTLMLTCNETHRWDTPNI